MEGQHSRGEGQQPWRARGPFWACLALIALVAGAYGQSGGFDLVWDDHTNFVDFPNLRGSLGWWEIFTSPTAAFLGQAPGNDRMYRPLLAAAIKTDRAIWGLHPGGYHVSSILAHLICVLLLWRLVWWLTRNPWAAFAAGALLAVHPSAVGAVAFASARMDIMVGLSTAAILLLLRECFGSWGKVRLGTALGAFLFALGCKETAAFIPLFVSWIAWVLPVWFRGTRKPPRPAALILRVSPFWVLLGLYLCLRWWIIGGLAPIPVGLDELGTQVPRILVALGLYGSMTAFPPPAAADVRIAPPAGLTDERLWLGCMVITLLVAGLVGLRRRQPAAAVALGWYALALGPLANLTPIYPGFEVYVVERALYPALVGWCFFLGVVGWAAWVALERWRPRRAFWAGVGLAVAATFLGVTLIKVSAWRDDVTLWTATLVAHPRSAEARIALAHALAQERRLWEARVTIEQVVAMVPADPWAAFVHGWITELRGDWHEALRHYERAIALGKHDELAYSQVALLAARLKDGDRSARWFAEAAARFPRAAWPQVGLGWSHQREDRGELAQEHFARAFALEPNAPDHFQLLGHLNAADGHPAEAARAFRTALQIDPSFLPARRGLALVAEQEGAFGDAIQQWRHIATLVPAGGYRERVLAHVRWLTVLAGRRAFFDLGRTELVQ